MRDLRAPAKRARVHVDVGAAVGADVGVGVGAGRTRRARFHGMAGCWCWCWRCTSCTVQSHVPVAVVPCVVCAAGLCTAARRGIVAVVARSTAASYTSST